MNTYVFTAATEALMKSGHLVQVVSHAGHILPIARDVATGRFVEIARVVAPNIFGTLLQPITAVTQLVSSGILMGQVHQGFQKTYKELDIIKQGINSLQNSVGVLQTTTSLIGVGTVAGLALSAVNLHQILKLREDVKQMRLELKEGFIDLKKALKDQGEEIFWRIEEVAHDLKWENHRMLLVRANGKFLEATRLMETAMLCDDINIRNNHLANAQRMLSDALADYKNPGILSESNAAGYLRRVECAWAIEQAFILTCLMQNQGNAASERLSQLQIQMKDESLHTIQLCQSQDELDFLFPEIHHLKIHDGFVIENWKQQVDWFQTLSSQDKEQLASEPVPVTALPPSYQPTVDVKPQELENYERIKSRSHYQSLQDQLRFIVQPELRKKYEVAVTQAANQRGLHGLIPADWQNVPDLALANLYYYL